MSPELMATLIALFHQNKCQCVARQAWMRMCEKGFG
jgi:hypothetical protein